jgi:hypothetical protein
MVTLYDAAQYPSMMVLTDDGSLIKMWSGDHLPLIDEIGYYAGQGPST